jgi:hypothetical protein
VIPPEQTVERIFTLGDLDGLLDAHSRVVLVRRLIREGVRGAGLTVRR